MLPTVYAAEVSGDSTTATEETVSETTSEATASPATEESVDVLQPPPDETIETSPSTEGTESIAATDSTESTGPDSTDETTASEEEEAQPETIPEVLEELDSPELLAEDGIMLASATSGNVTLFDQASPDYTVRLSSQISVTYRPNGTGSAVTAYHKNLGWHFARYGGVLPE